jgi:hypothetical protein
MSSEHEEARKIAASFHGGQSSGLYALASTGTITERALREVVRDLESFEDARAVRELRWLREYISRRLEEGSRGLDDQG